MRSADIHVRSIWKEFKPDFFDDEGALSQEVLDMSSKDRRELLRQHEGWDEIGKITVDVYLADGNIIFIPIKNGLKRRGF